MYFAIDQFIVPMAESQAGDKAGEVAVQRRRSGRLSNKGSPTTIPEDDHIHTHTHHNHHSSKSLKELQRASLITFIAMAAHNVPEGLGVFFSALSNYKLGAKIAVSICLHNLPEGMALGIPIWAATRSVSRVLWLTFLNGLAEPIGVLIGGFLLKDSLNEAILCKILAGVGGMMACISMVELYPAGIRFSSKTRASIAFFVGMALTFVALELVASSF